jgi:hypothetical protein
MASVSDWKKKGIPKARMLLLRATKKKELVGIDLDAATAPVRGEEPATQQEAAHG